MQRILIIAVLLILAVNFFNKNENTFDETILANVDMKPFAVPIQEPLTKESKKQEFVKNLG